MNKRLSAAFIAALLALAAMPLGVISEARMAPAEVNWTVPAGYNEHDYNAVVSFLEQESYTPGVKNGQLLSEDYDANDPVTFTYAYDDENATYLNGMRWTEDDATGELRLSYATFAANVPNNEYGDSGCVFAGALDLSGCTMLRSIKCDTCWFTDLSLSGCTILERANLMFVDADALDFSGCAALQYINIDELHLVDYPHSFPFNVTGCASLTSININAPCYSPEFIGLNTCTQLGRLDIMCANASGIQREGMDNLKYLRIFVDYGKHEYDFSDCLLLEYACLDGTGIVAADLSGCTALETVNAQYCTMLRELNVSGCSALTSIKADYTCLEVLNTSGCTALNELTCAYAALTGLDLTDSPEIRLDRVTVNGFGFFSYDGSMLTAHTRHYDYYTSDLMFRGWYTEGGELITESTELDITGLEETGFVAEYDMPVPPPGYNINDFCRLLNFLEAPSAVEGKKNGQILNPDYDKNDMSTYSYDPLYGDSNTYSIVWELIESTNEYRLASIDIRNKHGLAGTLDLSSCVYLKAISLYDLPELTGLNIAVCSRLETLYCSACGVESVDGSQSYFDNLIYVYCKGTKLTNISLGNRSALGIRRINAAEGGTAAADLSEGSKLLSAFPNDGYDFTGWYYGSGDTFISADTVIDASEFGFAYYEARFAPIQQPIPGDMDGDGVLTFNDIASLYIALISGGDADSANGDFNGDGLVTFADVSELSIFMVG